MNIWPGTCEIANGGRETITTVCGVTPHAQNTGTSSGPTGTGSPKSGRDRSVMPSADGSPTCTGAPCTAGYRPVISTASGTSDSGIGRIDTTSGPLNRPAGTHGWLVSYIGTFWPSSRCRTGTPAWIRAYSNVKLNTMKEENRSYRQKT